MSEFPHASETSIVREMVMPFIPPKSNGLDLGFGGDPICPTAITVDLPNKYTHLGHGPQHLYGDATNLYWFKDESLDYIYSSHLLEDFADARNVVREWLRVLKPGGHLILCLPHEMRYRAHCEKTGQIYNLAHKCPEMSLDHMKGVFRELGVEPIFEWNDHPYSFLIVGRKL